MSMTKAVLRQLWRERLRAAGERMQADEPEERVRGLSEALRAQMALRDLGEGPVLRPSDCSVEQICAALEA